MISAEAPNQEIELQAMESLVELLGAGASHWLGRAPQDDGIDFVVEQPDGLKLAVQVKRSSEVSAIRRALEELEQHLADHPDEVPIVATLFMGPSGKELCKEHGIGWFDLSGNADVSAPGLRLLIDGKPNKFKRPGRPSSAFAPKSSRIARWLLIYGDVGWSQLQLTESTGLDKGYVSRVLKRLRGQSLIRLRGEKYEVDDRDLLLKAWQSHYDFTKHRIIKGVMPVRTGQEATLKIAQVLGGDNYVATGLSGAWFIDKFAMFRTATVYLREEPDEALFAKLSFTPGEKGANVWLVLPNDEGVFDGRSRSDEGVICAHWVQVYLDLASHPERASEAAEHLRQTQQNWGSQGG